MSILPDGDTQTPLPPTPSVAQAPAAVYLDPRTLRPWPGNPRVDHDVDGIARSIRRLGFGAPILARPDDGRGHEVIAGHGRLAAALQLGLTLVPVRIMASLDADEAHALALADNAYTDASRNDDALYAAAVAGLDEELARVLALPDPDRLEDAAKFADLDETVAARITMITCPSCGHEFPS